MKNKIQNGKVIDYLNSGSEPILGGAVVIAGILAGIAVATIPAGDIGAVELQGVFELPKVTGSAMAVGDKVYWSAANNYVTKTATDNTAIGAVVDAELAAATTVKVLLIQGA